MDHPACVRGRRRCRPLVGEWISELGDPVAVPLSVYLVNSAVVVILLATVRAIPPLLAPRPRGFFQSLRPPRPRFRVAAKTFFDTAGRFVSLAVFGFSLRRPPAFLPLC